MNQGVDSSCFTVLWFLPSKFPGVSCFARRHGHSLVLASTTLPFIINKMFIFSLKLSALMLQIVSTSSGITGPINFQLLKSCFHCTARIELAMKLKANLEILKINPSLALSRHLVGFPDLAGMTGPF